MIETAARSLGWFSTSEGTCYRGGRGRRSGLGDRGRLGRGRPRYSPVAAVSVARQVARLRWADRPGPPHRDEPRSRHRRPSSAGAATPTPLPGSLRHRARTSSGLPLVIPVRRGHRNRRAEGSAARPGSSVRATPAASVMGMSPGRDLGPGPRPRGNSGPRTLRTRRSVAHDTTRPASFRQAVPTHGGVSTTEAPDARPESRPARGQHLRRRHARDRGVTVPVARGGVEHRPRRRPAVHGHRAATRVQVGDAVELYWIGGNEERTLGGIVSCIEIGPDPRWHLTVPARPSGASGARRCGRACRSP